MNGYIKRDDAIKTILRCEWHDMPTDRYPDVEFAFNDALIIAANEVADIPAAKVVEQPRWIPVTERLPEDGEWVLVWGRGQQIPTMMFRESGAWIDDQFLEFHTTVTHWMPLPEPPKEDE